MTKCNNKILLEMKKSLKSAEIIDKIVNKEIIVDCSLKDFLDSLSQKKYDTQQK